MLLCDRVVLLELYFHVGELFLILRGPTHMA